MATKPLSIDVLVYNITRGPVSTNGNPSYVFHTDHGPYKTQTDNGQAYALENSFPVKTTLDIPVTLIITRAGRVLDWKA